MRKQILVLITFLSFTAVISAQNSEYQKIEQTLSYYLDGGTNRELETVKKAFHPNAMMSGIQQGKFWETNAMEFFTKVIKPGPKQNRKTRIAYINVTGDIANARLEIEYPTFMFIDYMSLLKIDGEWKIVGKIYHRKSFENKSIK